MFVTRLVEQTCNKKWDEENPEYNKSHSHPLMTLLGFLRIWRKDCPKWKALFLKKPIKRT
eukprot:9726685-Prorocentrum_lima.AAC.1